MATNRQAVNRSFKQSRTVPTGKLPTEPSATAGIRRTTRSGIQPIISGVESKSLLESLGVLDDLMQRKGLSGQRAALVAYKESILEQLAVVHGLSDEVLTRTELSGPAWFARFPDTRSTAELERTFKTGVDAFIASLKTAGATVAISSTYRSIERAYLMHYAFSIAHDDVRPQDVPAQPGVDIQWDHGNDAASKRGAQEMVDAYGIVKEPTLHSRHTERKAIDMTILWKGTLTLTDGDGKKVTINSAPRNGMNSDLRKVGRTFGVIKALFAGDPPHWSSDGH
ncbi:hypothetical protein P0D73_45030 [Paraburkholderia sp. RL18-101-BIB-B]|uniref:hypothetical protein n=1 Tax=Paraburkholderia sp. RL18-101-BIB-B TaxID=3031634 RepID=UPI0038B96389